MVVVHFAQELLAQQHTVGDLGSLLENIQKVGHTRNYHINQWVILCSGT